MCVAKLHYYSSYKNLVSVEKVVAYIKIAKNKLFLQKEQSDLGIGIDV